MTVKHEDASWVMFQTCIALTLALFSDLIEVTEGEGCAENSTGSACSLTCHCLDGQCDESGNCLVDSPDCEAGWLGVGCQYQDHAPEIVNSSQSSWIFDHNNATCNPAKSQTDLTFTFKEGIMTSWFRLLLSEKVQEAPRLQINDDMDCNILRTISLSDNNWDIQCLTREVVTRVKLMGSSVQLLCDIYISKGRELSFNKKGVGPVTSSINVVDNDIATCYEAKAEDDVKAIWFISFNHPLIISMFEIHGTFVKLQLASQGADNKSIYSYVTTPYTNFGTHHKIVDRARRAIVSVVVSSDAPSFELCEMRFWGDLLCTDDTTGVQCERSCSCEPGRGCLPFNGRCITETSSVYGECPQECSSGCSDDYLWCQECPSHFTGINCADCAQGQYSRSCDRRCARDCDGNTCERKHGLCTQCTGQEPQKQCRTLCPDGLWGSECNAKCPHSCKGNICNYSTGNCVDCEETFHLETCEKKDCVEPRKCIPCPDDCLDQICDTQLGSCEKCVLGRTGRLCHRKIAEAIDKQVTTQSSTSLLWALFIPVLLCMFGILCRSKRGQTQEQNFAGDPRAEEDVSKSTKALAAKSGYLSGAVSTETSSTES